jgi:hypothetical protein
MPLSGQAPKLPTHRRDVTISRRPQRTSLLRGAVVSQPPPATDPAGDHQNEELKRSGACHGQRTIAHPGREGRTAEDGRAIELSYTAGGGLLGPRLRSYRKADQGWGSGVDVSYTPGNPNINHD